MIELSGLTFAYPGESPVLRDISLTVPGGSHVALMGKNGTGKSTLALLVKGLLFPSAGTVTVDGLTATDDASRREVMKRVGLVFQNPDNTIVATTVERELAFGLENTGVPAGEMRARVEEALERFDLQDYRYTNPSHLSGGEKQRLALVAVMIMRPSHLILDEPTSLLDPWSRGHILELVHDAAREGATVVHITQFPEEAGAADRVIVLDETGIAIDASPGEALENPEFKASFTHGVVRRVSACLPLHNGETGEPSPAVALESVTHVYEQGTPFAHTALDNVSLALPSGTSTVLLGPTGAGKTTLLEIAAGVTAPTGGKAVAGEPCVRAMAFQFPEDQMFGDTVEAYIAFGPLNIGVSNSDIYDAVNDALEHVGLDPGAFRERDPFTLSGGEKRRAALAGVLAMKPDVLVLDEPFAGLDSDGTGLILVSLRNYLDGGGTLFFSTHDVRVARCVADYAVVLDGGRIESAGGVGEVFERSEKMSLLENS